MANFEFLEALGQIARDQNIDEGELLIALANALLAAYKRRPDSAEDAEVEINPETGEIKVWGLELDLEGNVTREWDATPEDFGRIAAQTAKQVIIQRTREAERENTFNEYKDRKGELITGIVRRFERGNIIVDLGRTEGILPQKHQTPRETYRPGDRIVAFLTDIDREIHEPDFAREVIPSPGRMRGRCAGSSKRVPCVARSSSTPDTSS